MLNFYFQEISKTSNMDKSKNEESKSTVQSFEDQNTKALDRQMCQKTFPRLGDINTHMKRIHNQRKSYKCELCDKAFVTNSQFQRHVSIVHLKKKDFNCEFCN